MADGGEFYGQKECNCLHGCSCVQAPVPPAVGINAAISRILGAALSGLEPRYRNAEQFIRWGLVEKDMHDAVNAVLQPNHMLGGNGFPQSEP
jgi:hypothetical protein